MNWISAEIMPMPLDIPIEVIPSFTDTSDEVFNDGSMINPVRCDGDPDCESCGGCPESSSVVKYWRFIENNKEDYIDGWYEKLYNKEIL